MKMLLSRIEKLICGWNERPLDEDDFYRLCSEHDVTVVESPLQTSGFYFSMRRKHFIAVNSELRGPQRLFVMFHEFAHFYLHAPNSGAGARFHGVGRKTRQEAEADLFAVCAIMPRSMIEMNTAGVLSEEFGLPGELIAERVSILRTYGI